MQNSANVLTTSRLDFKALWTLIRRPVLGTLLLCLLLFATACGSNPFVVRKTEVLETPPALLTKQEPPPFDFRTNGDLLRLANRYKNGWESCNADKDKIAEWQQDKVAQTKKKEPSWWAKFWTGPEDQPEVPSR